MRLVFVYKFGNKRRYYEKDGSVICCGGRDAVFDGGREIEINDGKIVETKLSEAEKLMWQYSDMPAGIEKENNNIKLPDMPLSPKDDTDILPENKNEGWWN